MWFKQASIFQLTQTIKMDQQALSDALSPLSFTPCLPSLSSSMGWISPLASTEGPLVYGNQRYWMICLQFEEKLLPASVVRQVLAEKIEAIEKKESRVVRGKEKQSLKDDIIQTLLPKAFTKKSCVYGYIDHERRWLIINTSLPAKVERFVAFLKRAITTADFKSLDIQKPAKMMTEWLTEDAPLAFQVGQSGVLQDAQQQRRVIRCQHQDLSATAIQSLLKEGCEVTQLALAWKDQLQFTLCSDFSLKNIRFQEAVIALSESDYTETPQQRFDADFVIMTQVLTQLIEDLYAVFTAETKTPKAIAA